jgi:hypothetical protein
LPCTASLFKTDNGLFEIIGLNRGYSQVFLLLQYETQDDVMPVRHVVGTSLEALKTTAARLHREALAAQTLERR